MDNTILQRYLTRDNPVGPIGAELIKSPAAAKLLFDHENKIYAQLLMRPAYIFGRRGAGKTAFLRSMKQGDEVITVELRTWEQLSQVIEYLSASTRGMQFVEEAAEIWKTLLWTTIIHEVAKKPGASTEIAICKEFSKLLRMSSARTIDKVLASALNVLTKMDEEAPRRSHQQQTINPVKGKISFSDAQNAAEDYLLNNNGRALILMDSLETYDLTEGPNTKALSGLFKCIADLNGPESVCNVRCCFPTEIMYELRSKSENTLKDFADGTLLQWHASELVSILAHRLKIYFDIHEAAFARRHKTHLAPVENRQEALALISLILPQNMNNEFMTIEVPTAYILRHTQLLPRQLLMTFRTIFETNRRYGGENTNISERAIVDGVKQAASLIVEEVFTAFRSTYPTAEQACSESIRELPQEFNDIELEKIFTQHVKKVMLGEDFSVFISLLRRIGAVGKLLSKTDKYIIAEFQYTGFEDDLTISSSDMLCVHPMFRRKYGTRSDPGDSLENRKAVYPSGSDHGGIDYRQFRHH